MTSETSFARNHTSTWRLLAPVMDLFIRKINLQLYEREFPVLKSEVASDRRGLINEIAFNVYCASPNSYASKKISGEVLERAIDDAKRKISLLESIPAGTIIQPSRVEMDDCVEQVRRLRIFFSAATRGHEIEFRPYFPGAGIIESCHGDIYFNSVLFEVKAGQRTFRAVDLKQLLTYAALNNSAQTRTLGYLGLFNPRMGISFCANLDSICMEISGCAAAELLSEITRVISSGDTSR